MLINMHGSCQLVHWLHLALYPRIWKVLYVFVAELISTSFCLGQHWLLKLKLFHVDRGALLPEFVWLTAFMVATLGLIRWWFEEDSLHLFLHHCRRPANLQIATTLHLLINCIIIHFVYLLIAVLEELESDALGFEDSLGRHELLLPIQETFIFFLLLSTQILLHRLHNVALSFIHFLAWLRE